MCMYTLHTRPTAIHTIDNNAPLETKSLKCITSVPRDRSASFIRRKWRREGQAVLSFRLFYRFAAYHSLPSLGARDRLDVSLVSKSDATSNMEREEARII